MEAQLNLLVTQAQQGEKEAFGRIYKLFLPKIYRFVYLKVGDRFLAEDLTQTAFLKAWVSLPSFSLSKGTFQAYLFRIAHNLVVDQFRKKKEVSLELLAEPPAGESLEQETTREDENQLVKKILKDLKPEEAELLALYFFEELKPAEIGNVIGKNEGAIRVKIHRLLKTLREKLTDKNYGVERSF